MLNPDQYIILESHLVPEGTQKTRLQEYIKGQFELITTGKGLKKAIKRKEVLLNGIPRETGAWVNGGDEIMLIEYNRPPAKVLEIKLKILFEDDDLAVILKPGGLASSGNFFRTVEQALSHNLSISARPDALKFARVCHRLDASTSGLMLIAKTRSSLTKLKSAFQNKAVQKKYNAVVIGKAPPKAVYSAEIDGKEALTEALLIHQSPSRKNKYLSLLEVKPHTGRKHQIRKHLSDAGFPILGDALYGETGFILKGKGLFLCATNLDFAHPVSGELISFQIQAPPKFLKFMAKEEKRSQ